MARVTRKWTIALRGLLGACVCAAIVLCSMAYCIGGSQEVDQWEYLWTVSRPLEDNCLSDKKVRFSAAEQTVRERLLPASAPLRVALIDTGVDPSLLEGVNVKDWIDLTSEGRVSLKGPIMISEGKSVFFDGRTFDASQVVTKSSKVYMGQFEFPRDTSPEGSRWSTYILAADETVPGKYSAVYIDVDGDCTFTAEERLIAAKYNLRGLDMGCGTSSVGLAEVDESGRWATLAFDSHGHGTATWSVICESVVRDPEVCSNVVLVVIKALGRDGKASLSTIVSAIDLACQRGANLIFLGAFPADAAAARRGLSEYVRSLLEKSDVLLVAPAGNLGPGLGSIGNYADWEKVITVGSYIDQTSSLYLEISAKDVLWPETSCGPAKGGHGVTLLAQAAGPVVGTGNGRRLLVGTSYSAAVAARICIEVWSSLKARGYSVSGGEVKALLTQVSEVRPGIPAVLQGAGVLSESGPLDALDSWKKGINLRVVFAWGGVFFKNAVWERDKAIGQVPMSIENLSPFHVSLRIHTPPGMLTSTSEVTLPPVDQFEAILCLSQEKALPGLQSEYITLDETSGAGTELKVPVSWVVPRDFGPGARFSIAKYIEPGAVHREFVRIPAGTDELGVRFEASDGLRFRIYDPEGTLMCEGSGTPDKEQVIIHLPRPGTWEVCVFSGVIPGAEDPEPFRLSVSTNGSTLSVEKSAQEDQESFLSIVDERRSYCGFAEVFDTSHGDVVAEKVVTLSSSTMESVSLPSSLQEWGLIALCVDTLGEEDLDVDAYVYRYDPSRRSWEEAEWQQYGKSGSLHWFILRHPKPGVYTCYVGSPHLDQRVTVRVVLLAKGNDNTVNVSPQSMTITPGIPSRVNIRAGSDSKLRQIWLALYEAQTAEPRMLLPLLVGGGTSSPVITVMPGLNQGDVQQFSVRVWEPDLSRPTDAIVTVGKIGFQTYKGYASVKLPLSSLVGGRLKVCAEHPQLGSSEITVTIDMR